MSMCCLFLANRTIDLVLLEELPGTSDSSLNEYEELRSTHYISQEDESRRYGYHSIEKVGWSPIIGIFSWMLLKNGNKTLRKHFQERERLANHGLPVDGRPNPSCLINESS